MDSKLPKPSGLRRPMQVTKSILPADRIKAGVGLMNKTAGVSANIVASSFQPLTRDLTNMQSGPTQRKARAASPEPMSSKTKDVQPRTKLRRSRSACDIRDMPLNRKRIEPTLSTIPAKTSRMASGGPVGHTQRNFASTTTKKNTGPSARVLNTRTATGSAASNNKIVKPTSTTGSSKRIAPYDYKARYNDLLEKHKILKAKHEKQCEDMVELESLPVQLEEMQTMLIAKDTELKNVKTENECLQRQVQSQIIKIDTITCSLGNITKELSELKQVYSKTKEEYDEVLSEVLVLRERCETLEKQLEQLNTCKELLFQSNIARKDLHNTIMDLRGNIRVLCRVRPPLACEQGRILCGWNFQDTTTVEIQTLDVQTKNKTGSQVFTFDQVFHPNSTQTDIFEMVSPLIQSALDGYNICIFAYGQTGSGKTYTMDGVPDNVGVIPRTVDLLFDSIKNYKNLGWEYEIKVTFLEIYNEVLYDLLSNEAKEMEIRMAKNNKNDIYVSNITEETVSTADHLRQLMDIAKMNRATTATVGNERSSRSHAVTKLELIGRHTEKQETSIGSINLVDLAGSESPKTSTRMTETKNINRSLSELTNVILALLQKQDHIPYRNSKLTHLLMPSLGGNSKTLMFVNVAPFQDCYQESVKSLRFAASVNSCKLSKAKRNRFLNISNASSSSFEK